ncbi:MAG: sigma-70 region 4 domain-containing protein [Candidatus Competibacteraceae bacterium]
MSKVVDLPRIQAALKKLDQIAADHPEICGGGGTWTEEAVAEMIRQKGGTPAKQRVAAYRQRLAERGYKREVFFVSPQGQSALLTLREQYPDKTRDQIFEDIIFAKLAAPPTASGESESTQPVAVNTDRDQQILELHRQGLKTPEIGRRFNTSEGSIRRALQRGQKKEETTG